MPDSPQALDSAVERPNGLRGDDAKQEVLHGMALLIEKGLPLSPGLRAMASETGDSALRRALLTLSDDLDAGKSLSDAIADHSTFFSPRWRALLAAGLRTGRLGELVAGMAAEQDLGQQIKRQLRTILFYPAALLLLFLCVFLPILIVIGRHFAAIYRDFGVNLDWVSAVFITALDRIGSTRLELVLAPLAGIAVAYGLYRVLLTPTDRARFRLSLPLFGPVYRYVPLSDFCSVLAWLLEAETPLPEALEVEADANNDPLLADACATACQQLRRGIPLEQVLDQHPFPPGFGRYLGWAVSLQEPAEALRLAGSIFAERARGEGRFAATFLSVLALSFVLIWCSLGVILIMTPMLRMLWVLVL